MKKKALGKGLDALIPTKSESQKREDEKYRILDISQILPNPKQPRKFFEKDKLRQLASSIKQKGLLQPILVRRNNGSFEIVAGERRFRAAESLGLEQIPVLVLEDLSQGEVLELSIIENLQREDLNPIELARGYQVLLSEFSLTQSELSERVGKDRSSIANTLRLLQLPLEIKEKIETGKLKEGHARAILALESEQDQLKLTKRIESEELSVRSIEEIIYGAKKRTRGRPLKLKSKPLEITQAENILKRKLGTNVTIQRGLKHGKMTIHFYGDQDLTRILEVLGVVL